MNALQAKIAARNNLNAFIKHKVPEILEALKPLVGKKVVLGDGSLSKAAEKILNPIFESVRPKFQIFKSYSEYSLYLTFKTSEPTGEFGCVYQESTVNFGTLESGVLTKLNEFSPEYYKSDYSYESVTAIQKEIEDLNNKRRQLESSIFHFLN